MAERFRISRNLSSFTHLEERLKEYPELKAKIDSMLAIIENGMKTNRVYLKCLTSKTRPYLRLRD
jgi:hypothetical protein